MREFIADKLLSLSSALHVLSVATKDLALRVLIRRRRTNR